MSLLKELSEFDEIYSSTEEVKRVNNVNVIQLLHESETHKTKEKEEVAVCHVGMLMPFSHFVNGEREPQTSIGSVSGSAAVLLAMNMINTGDGSVVQEVEGLNERCNIRFTMDTFDTEMLEESAVREVISRTSTSSNKKNDYDLCAWLGAARSAVSIPTSILTSIHNQPQLSPISTSVQLDGSQYSLFGRLVTSDEGTALSFILYLKSKQVEHLAVVYINDSYGTEYQLALLRSAAIEYPELKIESTYLSYDPSTEDIIDAVKFLERTKYRWFFGIIFDNIYDEFMTAAYDHGIAGTGEHVWMFSDGIGACDTITNDKKLEPYSKLHQATKSVGLLTPLGGRPGMSVYDKFIDKWKLLNNELDRKYIESKQPKYKNEPEYKGTPIDNNLFNNIRISAPFLFDEVIAYGLAACNISNFLDSNHTNSTYFDGQMLFDQVKQTNFVGATGEIILNEETATRDPKSSLFLITNCGQGDEINGRTGFAKFSSVETDLFTGGHWTSLAPYVYSDGTPDTPSDLPVYKTDYNYIGTALRFTGILMAGVAILLAIFFACWTHCNRKSRVVRASQPVFLLFICAGVLLMGSTIIPLSIDDEVASERGCSLACMAVPWLFTLGFSIVFAALFSKTRRINRIFHNPSTFRRVKVTAFDVMQPLIVLLGLNIIILTLWTILSPLYWERSDTVYNIFEQPIESNGLCTSDGAVPYFIAIVILNLAAFLFAFRELYVARDISTEFAESEYITKSVVCILLVSFVGLPVIIIVQDEPRGRYFVIAGIVFVICMSLLLFIFLPKMWYHYKKTGRTHNDAMASFRRKNERIGQAGFRSHFCTEVSIDRISQESTGENDTEENEGSAYFSPIMKEKILTKRVDELSQRVAELESLMQQKEDNMSTLIYEGKEEDNEYEVRVNYKEGERSELEDDEESFAC